MIGKLFGQYVTEVRHRHQSHGCLNPPPTPSSTPNPACGTPSGQINLDSQGDVDAIGLCTHLDGQGHVGQNLRQLNFPNIMDTINDGVDAIGGSLQSIRGPSITSIGNKPGTLP